MSQSAAGPEAEHAPAQPESANRGSLQIDRSVVRKIAAHAASTVGAAGGRSGGLLGIGSSRDITAAPEADVVVSGNTVIVTVRCGVAYPAPLRETTEQVRAHVADSVAKHTGLDVTRVDIDVRWLARVEAPSRLR